jgi:hypothetical protein
LSEQRIPNKTKKILRGWLMRDPQYQSVPLYQELAGEEIKPSGIFQKALIHFRIGIKHLPSMHQNGLWAELIIYIPLWFEDIGDLTPGSRPITHEELAVCFNQQTVNALFTAAAGDMELGAENTRFA